MTGPTELEMLHRYLAAQREHVLSMLEGLDDDAMARAVLPSGWSCLSLLHHLTLNELLWFGCVVAGDPDSLARLQVSTDWQLPDGATTETVLTAYRAQVAASDRVIEAADLDQPFAWWPDVFGGWRLDGLRELMLHEIAEMACHAGQLDAVRELIDGRQFVVLD